MLVNLLPLDPDLLADGQGPNLMRRCLAKTFRSTPPIPRQDGGFTRLDLVERWPFRIVLADAEPETVPLTCLRLVRHRLRTDAPLDYGALTLSDVADELPRLEDEGLLTWLTEANAYLGDADPARSADTPKLVNG